MQRYASNVQDRAGNALVGASVLITDNLGDPASLYAGASTSSGVLANPIKTNLDGEYAFYAPNGRYGISISVQGFISESLTDLLLYDPSEPYTPIDATIANSAASAFASKQAAADSATAAAASSAQTALDKIATNADRTQTGLDRVSTASDAETTAGDRTAAHSDRLASDAAALQTASDKSATAADRVQTGADRVKTTADAAQTALDRIATGNDRTSTAADAATATTKASDALASKNAAAISETNAGNSATDAANSAASINPSNLVHTADLAASSGASLVGWIRSATGAVLTTLAKWLGWQPPSIFDFMTDAQIADYQSGALTLDLTAPIQAAIASFPAAGGTLIYPPGNAKLAGTLTGANNVRHFGPGATLTQTANNTRIFNNTGLAGFSFEELTLVGVGYADTASTFSADAYGSAAFAIGIYINGCQNWSIRNCTFKNFLNSGIAAAYFNNAGIENNTISGTYQGAGDTKTPPGNGTYAAFGIHLYAGNSGLVPSGHGNVRVTGNAINAVCHGIYTGPGYVNIIVQKNQIRNLAQHGCYLNPGDNLVVSDNQISDFSGDGIKVQTTSVAMNRNPSGVIIADNTITNAPNGIWGIIVDVITGAGDTYTTLYTESVSITGNVLYNCGSGGIYAGHCRHSKIADNIVNNISGTGIQVLAYDGDISDNSLYSIFTVGITVTPDNYGTVEVANNVIRACTTVSGAGYITATSANVPYTYTGSTNYGANNYVQNGANVYVAVTSGTSGGGGGPTGTGSGQVDGTVTWDYVGSLAAVDKGTLYATRNRVIYKASDTATYALYIGGAGLSLYWKDNAFPLEKTVSIGAATILCDDNNMHGGYVVVPAALATIRGHHCRQFHTGQIPTVGAYQIGDIAWNILPAPSGNIGWICTTGGTPGTWKAFGAISA